MQSSYIAMWSGPRNVSTALMRSFGSRADTVVIDEPLYAHYLRETGLEHPMREQILASQDQDWRRVVAQLSAALPAGKSVSYQKHMAHHLLPDIDTEWLVGFEQAFLIRDPRPMLVSLERGLGRTPTLGDTGLPQQAQLFEALRARDGCPAAVLDSRDLLRDPAGILSALCARLGLDFDPAMLSWEAGARETDGCWAPIWYAGTHASTGFVTPDTRADVPVLSTALEEVAQRAQPLFDLMYSERLAAH